MILVFLLHTRLAAKKLGGQQLENSSLRFHHSVQWMCRQATGGQMENSALRSHHSVQRTCRQVTGGAMDPSSLPSHHTENMMSRQFPMATEIPRREDAHHRTIASHHPEYRLRRGRIATAQAFEGRSVHGQSGSASPSNTCRMGAPVGNTWATENRCLISRT